MLKDDTENQMKLVMKRNKKWLGEDVKKSKEMIEAVKEKTDNIQISKSETEFATLD